jgi:integrase
VFSTVDGGLLSPDNLSRDWHRVCRARRASHRAVSLTASHPCIDLVEGAGVDVMTVSRRLGHASASMTLNVYGHLIEGADAAAAKAIEGVLK